MENLIRKRQKIKECDKQKKDLKMESAIRTKAKQERKSRNN